MGSDESLLPSPLLTAPNNPFTIPNLSTRGISMRAVMILSLITLSLWANYEASKGFDLTIHNASSKTLTGSRFNLMFVSNGNTAKLLLQASDTIEHILYPGNTYVKKPVRRVILELAPEKTTEIVQVMHRHALNNNPGEYLILISPEILEGENATMVIMAEALYKAMCYVWLWDGTTATRRKIVDAMVEYLMVQYSRLHSIPISKNKSAIFGYFVQNCDSLSNDFVARLNNEMHEQGSERMIGEALNQMVENLCLKHLQLASSHGEFARMRNLMSF